MKKPIPVETLSENTSFRGGDVFVLFGELFGRGYATGLVDQARRAGMRIVGITVGRRDENNDLRPLTEQELLEAEQRLGGTIINIPLMAGFDLDAPEGFPTPIDLLADLTLDSWERSKLDWAHIEKCQAVATARFTDALAQVMSVLDGIIPDGSNVFFAHTMAGGIPKAKVFLVVANRIYKGTGARHMSSQALVDSDMGKLILRNFDEVSANTFRHLIEASSAIRGRIEASGGQVRYTAYGYHGTSILIDGEYRWQTYTNYTQGYAKIRLEGIAENAWASGVKATVYNCPEIRTNSSDVFTGIELPLIPLLLALRKENGCQWADEQWRACEELLSDRFTLEDVVSKIGNLQASDVMVPFYDFAKWPMPNSQAQADLTIGTSNEIAAMHRDGKFLISDVLSALVVEATGQLIFGASSSPQGPVQWLNHDIVAQHLNASHAIPEAQSSPEFEDVTTSSRDQVKATRDLRVA
ncbi:enoyl ACP reductase FabMG family protein [Agrobacterium tumefaciens]|uniref:enoyl ACP reductase FabMG family protein n=1 Tax=Agrobacterium tumefaciens TaxID=358 RepID=UPI002FDBE961